ncbi:MAG TPA: helix-turn-helix transcriptional regulator [Vicinamibacterales bacterium]|nr:helix-turn-helix transcriptional regulator [Vicinamibacterales bacterium]
MSDSDSFGPWLRSERERRGLSLETIAVVTKVGADLWDGLERNDFSRWPSGIFARAFVRDYARAVGLDADEVVNEFCRLFPIGDRRANRIIEGKAQLLGHKLMYSEPGALPPEGDRRARPVQQPPEDRLTHLVPGALAAAIDVFSTLGVAGSLSMTFGIGFWACAGVISLMYYTVATVMHLRTPGVRVVKALRHRVPALFAIQDRWRAAA